MTTEQKDTEGYPRPGTPPAPDPETPPGALWPGARQPGVGPHPVFGDLDAADRPLIYAEARRLLRCALGEGHPLAAPLQDALARRCGAEVVAAAPTEGQDVDPGVLAAIHRRLVAQERIMTAWFAAAVAAQPRRSPDGRSSEGGADQLGGWVVAATLLRLDVKLDEHCMIAGADALRLLKTKDPAPDLGRIDLAGVTGFVGAVERLKTIRRDPGDGPVGEMFGDRLEKLHALLHAAATGRDPDDKSPARRRWAERAMPAPDDDDDGPPLIDLSDGDDETADRDDADRDQPEEERRADEPRGALYVSQAGATVEDRERAAARTATAVAVAATRALALPAEPDVLTAYGARVILEAALAAPDDPALQVLALVLMFGRRAARLKQAFASRDAAATARWSLHPSGYVLDLSMDLPDLSRPGGPFDDPERRPAAPERVRLAPPPWIDVENLHEVDKADLDQAIAALRPRLALPLSEGRIAGWLQAWLQRKGADMAMIGVLCGLAPAARAQMHYTVMSGDAVRAAWERALIEGLGLEAPTRIDAAAHIGSSVRPRQAALRQGVAALAARAAIPLDPAAPPSVLAGVHNAFALYTLELLFLSTGHRPVSAPFGRYGDHDLATGVMWISDKDTRGGPAARIVALPPFAAAQLRFWEEHLRALALRLERLGSPVPRTRITPVFTPPRGGEPPPLFFFLDRDGGVVEASQTAMGERRRGVLPEPTNAARHMLRTHLVAVGMAPHAIDAVLGHGHLGEEPLTFDSALRFDDLKRIAMAAQALLEETGFTPLRSPLCQIL